jgi:3-hydroxybutyryl-CoA dehydrogenase
VLVPFLSLRRISLINHIIVIGSGVMGRGIAYVSAVGGFQTTLVDVNEEQLLSAKSEVENIFLKGIERGVITEGTRNKALEKLSYTTNLIEASKLADLIIEAVPEKTDIKKEIFEIIDTHAEEYCFFATNTSTMSPTEIVRGFSWVRY